MLPRLSRLKALSLLGFIVTCTVIGAMYLPPKVHIDWFTGGCFGFLFAVLVSHILLPELRKTQSNVWNGKNILGIKMKNYFSHPTQIPLIAGMLWFLTMFVLMYLFDFRVTNDSETTFFMGMLIPSFLLFGLSGFLMLRRNEYVDKFGIVRSGFWAKFNGTMGILFGWGSCIAILVILIFGL